MTIYEKLNQMLGADSKINNLNDRRDHVSNLVESNMDVLEVYSAASHGKVAEGNPYNVMIEELGSYLLRSKDVSSTRSGEYSFFEKERDYRKLAIGKNSYGVVFGDKEGEVQIENTTTDSEEIPFDYEYYCDKLKNIDSMFPYEIANLLKNSSKIDDLENFNEDIRESAKFAQQEILRRLTDETDIEIIKMIIAGYKQVDIASKMGINQSNVNRRFHNICKNKVKK